MRGFVPIAGLDEARKERVGTRWLRLELGMELAGEVPGMPWQLSNFDELAVGRTAGDLQAVLGERRLVQAVEFVPVAMPLVDQPRSIGAFGQRARRQLAGVLAEAHCAAQVVDAEQVAQFVDDLRRR